MRNGFILLSGLLLVACQPFYQFSSSTKEHDLYRMYDMKVGKDTLVFNAYFDYYYDTVNLAQVYLTHQEVRKIKKATIPNQRGKQILFLHDQMIIF